MVNGIVVNGVYVNTPGAYGEAFFPPTIGNTVPLKSLAIMAELAYLPPAVPLEVTSKEAFERIMPTDLELLRLSSITYAPANDERVPGGPASVWLCNVRPSTQAFIELVDGDDLPALRLESTVWGPKGNQTYVTVEEDAGVYDLTVRRDGVVESYTGLSGESLFSFAYDVPDTGAAALTIDVVAVAGTFTRTTGSFLTDGFAVGDVITTSGFTNAGNNTTKIILTVTALVITVTDVTGLVDESGNNNERVRYTAEMTTVVAEFTPGDDFVISATKTLIALGTLVLSGHPWDGVVTLEPSIAPGVGESFTAIVTAINKATGVSEVATTLTWPAGDSDPQSTTIEWSELTQIVLAASAGAPTFTLSGEVLRAEPADVPTVASLIEVLSNPPYGTAGVGPAFTVTAVSSLAGSVRLDQVDPIPADTDVKTSAYTMKNVVQTLVVALQASGLVTATAVAGGGALADAADARLLGGSAGPTTATDWDAAFTAMRQVAVRTIVPMSDSSAIHAKAKNHAVYMGGPGAFDCNIWVGAAAQETKTQLATRTQALNSRSVSLVAQEIEREGPLGTMEWLTPKYLALLCAAMQCGTREAITAKVPAVNAFRQHTSWTPDADKTELHNKRVAILGTTLDEQTSGQIRVLRALSTFWLSADPCRTDVRPVESTSELLIFTRSHFRQHVGTNTTAPLSVIEKEWLSVLRRAKDLGIIQDYDATSARAVRLANVTTLKATVVPVFSNDFVKVEIGVVPTLQSTTGSTFQLALAA